MEKRIKIAKKERNRLIRKGTKTFEPIKLFTGAGEGSFFFKKNGQTPASVSFISVFSNKHYKFLQQIYVKKCPSSIQCQDSNPWPSECKSPPVTTRPGLPPMILETAECWKDEKKEKEAVNGLI